MKQAVQREVPLGAQNGLEEREQASAAGPSTSPHGLKGPRADEAAEEIRNGST